METKFLNHAVIDGRHSREIAVAFWLHAIWKDLRARHAPNNFSTRALHAALIIFERTLRREGYDLCFGWDAQSNRCPELDRIIMKFSGREILKETADSRADIREFREPAVDDAQTPSAGMRLQRIFMPSSNGEALLSAAEVKILRVAIAESMSTYHAALAQYPEPPAKGAMPATQ